MLCMLGLDGHKPKPVTRKSFDSITEKSMCIGSDQKKDLPEAYKLIEEKFDKKEMQEARETFKIIIKDRTRIKVDEGWSLQEFGKTS